MVKTKQKTGPLLIILAGCVLVSGISGNGITPAGLLVGLGSGIQRRAATG